MNDLAIKLENVSKYYKLYNSPKDRLKESLSPFRKHYHKEFYALKDINLEVKKGEILGIIGKNGSGKSTLLKLISKVLSPNSGSVYVNGTISALLELGAGFNPEFTGIENVYFYGTLLGLTADEMEERIGGILAFADIGDFIHQPLKTYSSGMKARLGFAVATEVNPDILIVDEVLAVGDAIFQRKCYAKMETLIKDGKTVLLVSHSRNNIASLCSRAIFLHNGRCAYEGDTNKAIREYEAYINSLNRYGNSVHEKKENINETVLCSVDATNENPDNYDLSIEPEPELINGKDILFTSFGLYNKEGQKVNILNRGESYFIKATFEPIKDLSNIQFAMRILNTGGLRLSWMGFPLEKNTFLSASKGEQLVVEFSFDCNLLSETYFIDASLQSYLDTEIHTYVGYRNIYAFRVLKERNYVEGIVNMNYK